MMDEGVSHWGSGPQDGTQGRSREKTVLEFDNQDSRSSENVTTYSVFYTL